MIEAGSEGMAIDITLLDGYYVIRCHHNKWQNIQV
jgi:hypothetical protein